MNLQTATLAFSLVAWTAAASAGAALITEFPGYPGLTPTTPSVVTADVTDGSDATRHYSLSTTAPQREGATHTRLIEERAGEPRLRSASLLFDALFAQAIDDARLDSVKSIRDDAYNDRQAIRCDCFQTGEKWRYVWTRDLSYSSDLALAWLDPTRTANSLRFKTSEFRPGVPSPAQLPAGSWQIVQDTGSGGSWPVSSDRVIWAIGAEAVLANLQGSPRRDFAAAAWRSVRGTLEADRLAAFDPIDGLYAGEQSFLDWREQTYAPYVVDDLTQIAQSKALSTNVAHYRALRLGARLATEQGARDLAARYTSWAETLRVAINERFWLADRGLYASITTADARSAPVERFDMLGEALAVLSGIADPDRAREVMAHYPHAPFGVPVYFPEQPGIPVYHNRAIWPFVTAYSLQAAALVRNTAAADNAFDSLMRSAALHLTNTENLEWLSGASAFDDGPVINSPRQIWSVAAYISMTARTLFGYTVTDRGVAISPFLTAHMRDVLGGDQAALSGMQFHGRRFEIRLHLPPAAREGYFPVSRITLNGNPSPTTIAERSMRERNVVDVFFGGPTDGDRRLNRTPLVSPASHDDPAVFAPPVPSVHAAVADGHTLLTITQTPGAGSAVSFDVARDGAIRAQNLSTPEWRDPEVLTPAIRHCYRVTARYVESGNASHPSVATCVGTDASRSITLAASNGSPEIIPFSIDADGRYEMSLTYDNHAYALNTGITNAVKRVTVLDSAGRVVADGVIQMPHIRPVGIVHPLRQSTALRTSLPAGGYVLKIDDFFNMSYLQANSSYAHPGGASGPLNSADVTALVIVRIPEDARH